LEIDPNCFVVVPDCEEFETPDELTVACWAKFEVFAPEVWEGNTFDFKVCRWNHAQGHNRCFKLHLASHVPGMLVSSDGTDAGIAWSVGKEPVEIDQWYNIMGVYDGSKVKVYVNGEEVASEDHPDKIFAGVGPITIGDDNFGSDPNFHFVGVIDEVAVYNRALSRSEIEQKMALEPEGKLATTWGQLKSS
jgi:hypothetical protein